MTDILWPDHTEEVRVLAATGLLGSGFQLSAFRRGVDLAPHVIACDAGSTDLGPTPLGSGEPTASREGMERDLREILRARDELGVPLIIGSCGTGGRDQGVEIVAQIVRKICKAQGYSANLGLIYSDQPTDRLLTWWDNNSIQPLWPEVPLDREILADSTVVAMMGVEPIQKLLREGCDIILAGRASDTALYSALPHQLGLDPGLVWHAAKTIECGAACAVPPGADPLLARLRTDHFTVETLDESTRLTPLSVSAHTLYENADPYLITEPSGVLNTRNARYSRADEQTVRVEGAQFQPAEQYSLKLEGAALTGYQTIVIGGVRDRVIIEQLPRMLPRVQAYFDSRIIEVFDGAISPHDVDIDVRLYGANGVLGPLEPEPSAGKEIAMLITVTAPTQEIANSVARFTGHAASHLPIPEYDGLVSTLAFPFSPPEVDRGATYRFTLNHVVTPVDPLEPFRFETEVL